MYSVAYLDGHGKLVEISHISLAEAIHLSEQYSAENGYAVMYEISKNNNIWFKEGKALYEEN